MTPAGLEQSMRRSVSAWERDEPRIRRRQARAADELGRMHTEIPQMAMCFQQSQPDGRNEDAGVVRFVERTTPASMLKAELL